MVRSPLSMNCSEFAIVFARAANSSSVSVARVPKFFGRKARPRYRRWSRFPEYRDRPKESWEQQMARRLWSWWAPWLPIFGCLCARLGHHHGGLSCQRPHGSRCRDGRRQGAHTQENSLLHGNLLTNWAISTLLRLLAYLLFVLASLRTKSPYSNCLAYSTHLNSINRAFFSRLRYKNRLIFHGFENVEGSVMVAS